MSDELLEGKLSTAMELVRDTAIVAWSDDKKKDFCGTFLQRVEAAKYILDKTATCLTEKAIDRKFLSQKHCNKNGIPYVPAHERAYTKGRRNEEVGGRDVNDLDKIADERAENIIGELPGIKSVLDILDPEVRKKMDKMEKLKDKGQEHVDALVELAAPIDLADLDQDLTVGAFRKMLRERDARRAKLLLELREIGDEGKALEKDVNKALYSGIPGLTEAVVGAILQHRERRSALDEMCRRVNETVMFGDSDAALDLLKHFEADELKVSANIKAEFAKALEKLKLSAKKKRAS